MTQQRDLLEPFSEKVVKQVDKGSYKADYVSWTDKIQRLIMVLGGFDWTVEIIPGTWTLERRTSRGGGEYWINLETTR